MDTIAQSGTPFLIRGTTVWSIVASVRPVLAKSQAGEPTRAPESIAELPSGNYKILASREPYLLLHETTHDEILLVNLENPTEIILELTGRNTTQRIDENGALEFLSWNSFELWRASATNQEQKLLRRQGEAIQDVAWYPHGGYVAMASRDRVEMLELDSRGGRESTLLASFPGQRIHDIAINPDGTVMLITVADGPQAGLYSLELQ
jgi:hypothetical protein